MLTQQGKRYDPKLKANTNQIDSSSSSSNDNNNKNNNQKNNSSNNYAYSVSCLITSSYSLTFYLLALWLQKVTQYSQELRHHYFTLLGSGIQYN